MPASPDFASRLRALIAADGSISVERYMALCNAHYYATRDPLGAAGDFTTAPEISQMFGELIGLWAADLSARADAQNACWVELGPGRGTLSADARRTMASAGFAPPIHLVETSPVLRDIQARMLPGARHHEAIDTLPGGRPLIVIANEFFDALPIRQRLRVDRGWRERMIALDGDRFVADAIEGDITEDSPAAVAMMHALAARIVAQGGALLAIDYGESGPGKRDTLQAVRAHRFADPFDAPGEQDLTAHVDFSALGEAARAKGATVHPLTTQGAWLSSLGIAARAGALARGAPDRRGEIEAAWRRLCAPDAMGALFRAFEIAAPGWPVPAGFGMGAA